MVLFTFNSVPTPNNPFVVVNETETVSQINGDKITTVIDINYPKTNIQGSVNAIVNTTIVTTTPPTQTQPSSSSALITTGTRPVSTSAVVLLMSDGSTNTIFDSV